MLAVEGMASAATTADVNDLSAPACWSAFTHPRPPNLGRNEDDAVPTQQRRAGSRSRALLPHLFGGAEDQIEMLVKPVEDPAKGMSALHFHEHPLVEALLEDIERLHGLRKTSKGAPS